MHEFVPPAFLPIVSLKELLDRHQHAVAFGADGARSLNLRNAHNSGSFAKQRAAIVNA
jgi:hypothetical protein